MNAGRNAGKIIKATQKSINDDVEIKSTSGSQGLWQIFGGSHNLQDALLKDTQLGRLGQGIGD